MLYFLIRIQYTIFLFMYLVYVIYQVIVSKLKMRISKRELQETKVRNIFQKLAFLPPDINTQVCISGG